MKFSPDTSRLVYDRIYWCVVDQYDTPAQVKYIEAEVPFRHHLLWGDEVIPPTVEVEPERPPEPVLLPCPFCGGTLVHPSGFVGFIQCQTCQADGPLHYGKPAEAITAWNTRAAPAPAPAPAEPSPPAWVPPVCPAGQAILDNGVSLLVATRGGPLATVDRYPKPAWPPRIGEIVEHVLLTGVSLHVMVTSGPIEDSIYPGDCYVYAGPFVLLRSREGKTWRWVYRDLSGYVPPGGSNV